VVAEVQLTGFDVLSAEEQNDLRGRLPVRPGGPLTDKSEQAAGELAVSVLQNHGYPYAEVRIVRENAGSGRVRLIVGAEPGARGVFGPVEITGNRHVDDRIIRRRLSYGPGDLFSRSAIERSQARIGSLGLFKSVAIAAHDIDARPAVVPTRVTVEERRPWQWNAGVGYAAGERLSLDVRLSHLNLFGSARRIDLEGRLSRIERTTQAVFTQTDTWHPALSFSAQARHQEIEQRSFFALSTGGQGAVRWQWSPATASTVSYAIANERSSADPEVALLTGIQDGMLSAWSLDVDNRRPARTDSAPSQLLMLHVEQAGGWMPGTFNYYSAVGDARRYVPTAGGRAVLAGRLRYGGSTPFRDDSEIPLLKRFFLGGSEEMRGWSRFEIGPLSESGVVTGGKSLLSLTGEARIILNGRLTAVAFVEAGRVWQDSWRVHLNDLLYDAGSGLRVTTPFGLIRVDFGYQLNRLEGLRIDGQPEKHRWRINFGIGEAF
jgi:outer membrane protein insertion porin family